MTAIPLPFIYVLFLVSGGSALIYQVVWQRSLFTLYGVNTEAVAIVVSAFMLGLGLGSFAGGAVSKRPGAPLPAYFGIAELAIGVYGAFSLDLFHAVGRLTAGAGRGSTFLLSFGLVLVPTLLMGSTLPMLVAYAVRSSHNVGRSVGMLYFINTLGSGVASIAAGIWLLGLCGQQGSVWVAASGNALVGTSVLVLSLATRRPARSERGRGALAA